MDTGHNKSPASARRCTAICHPFYEHRFILFYPTKMQLLNHLFLILWQQYSIYIDIFISCLTSKTCNNNHSKTSHNITNDCFLPLSNAAHHHYHYNSATHRTITHQALPSPSNTKQLTNTAYYQVTTLKSKYRLTITTCISLLI